MANKTQYTVVAVVGIAVASAAGWWYQRQPKGPAEAASSGAPASAPAAGASAPVRPAGVEVARVQRMTLRDDAQSVGTLRSRQSVMLRPEVAGRVQRLGFADGAPVRRGQVLVQLDDTLQRAEIRQSGAQVAIAQANFKRNQELVAQNFVAQRVLDESSAALQVAEAQLALACARWERMRIVAPFDGTVGIRNVNVGDYVKDGADLVNLEDIGTLYVDFRLPERFQTRVRRDQEIELQIDAFPGRLFRARVEAIDPLIDANGRSIGLRAVMPNYPGEAAPGGRPGGPAAGAASAASAPRPAGAAAPATAARVRPAAAPARPASAAAAPPGAPSGRDALPCPQPAVAEGPALAARPATARGGGAGGGGPLRPGMFARVTTVFGVRENALTVPEEAIVPQGGRQFVVKVVEPSVIGGTVTAALPPDVRQVSQRVEVRLGVRRPGQVEILDGAAEGDTVVIAGQQRLQRDGTPVRIVELGRPSGRPGAPASAPASSSAPAPAPVPAASGVAGAVR